MRRITGLLVSGVLATLCGQALGAQQAPSEPRVIDVSTMGPQVGELIPDFGLPDQFGTVWTRQSIMGPKGAMIVFFRSADW